MREVPVETGGSRLGVTLTSGISIHAVDITKGSAARGLLVSVFQDCSDAPLLQGRIGTKGMMESDQDMSLPLGEGRFTVLFAVNDYFQTLGTPLPKLPFLDQARFDFHMQGADYHVHLPFKFAPWGFSLFRGNP